MTKLPVRNVLVTCGGGFQGLAILEGLHQIAGVRTIVADWSPDNVGRYFASTFRLSPPIADSDAYLRFLLDVVRAENVELVIPATDLDLELLTRERVQFERLEAAVAVSRYELLVKLMNKRTTYQFAVEAGVMVLEETDLDLFERVKSDLIVKPVRGFGGKGQQILRPGQTLSTAVPDFCRHEYIVQPFLEGAREFSVDFSIDLNGSVSPLVTRQRIRSFAGFSVLGRTASDRLDVIAAADNLSRHIASHGGYGGYNVQFLDHEGGPYLIDVNARFGASSSLSLQMGTNLQAWLLGEPAGEPYGDRGLLRYVTQASLPASAIGVAGIIFDLDDTLIDQKTWISGKLHGLHSQYSAKLPPRLEFLAAGYQILEEGNRAYLIDALIDRFKLPLEIRMSLIETYRTFIPPEITIYPDVVRVISELRARGFRVGLLTDNPASSQRQKLERLAIEFDAVTLTDEIGVTKPDPAAFFAAAKGLGVPPEELAMVGDNLFRDAVGAIRAGFAGAFVVKRAGSFFNYSRALAAELPEAEHVRWLDGLDQLLWHLPVSAQPNAGL